MKNKILKAITYLAGVAFIFGGSALDSQSWLPVIICGVSLAWLALFYVANWERINEC
jgi:hypothetical protein